MLPDNYGGKFSSIRVRSERLKGGGGGVGGQELVKLQTGRLVEAAEIGSGKNPRDPESARQDLFTVPQPANSCGGRKAL